MRKLKSCGYRGEERNHGACKGRLPEEEARVRPHEAAQARGRDHHRHRADQEDGRRVPRGRHDLLRHRLRLRPGRLGARCRRGPRRSPSARLLHAGHEAQCHGRQGRGGRQAPDRRVARAHAHRPCGLLPAACHLEAEHRPVRQVLPVGLPRRAQGLRQGSSRGLLVP